MRSSELLFRRTYTSISHSRTIRQPIIRPTSWSFSATPPVQTHVSATLSEGGGTFGIRRPSLRTSFLHQRRPFTATAPVREAKPPEPSIRNNKEQEPIPKDSQEELDHEEDQGFARSEKANQATQVNLSARLAKDGKSQSQWAGFGEVWRLVKIARPESKALGVAFVFLIISSSISMSIPFSIGKILDIATKSDQASDRLFGLDLSTFYLALGGVLALGAAANYGRIIILRIVGERIVARLRTQLYRRTFVQNAEFFDANRVGDLISRLSSDTIIVGKSITQNLSDGLRSLVSGGAGFGLMAYVSLKLTGVLTLMLPPVAIGAFFTEGRSGT